MKRVFLRTSDIMGYDDRFAISLCINLKRMDIENVVVVFLFTL